MKTLVPAILAAGLLLPACNSSTPAPTEPTGPPTPTTTLPPQAANHAPTLKITDVRPRGTALTFVTEVGFATDASDPDGDPLTYVWDFGDGTNATVTAPALAHVFNKAGTFTVRLTVSDGRGGFASATREVTARQLNGFWRGDICGRRCSTFAGEVRQPGYSFNGNANGVSFSGSLADVRNITFNVSGPGIDCADVNGQVNDAIDDISARTFSGPLCTLRLTRQ